MKLIVDEIGLNDQEIKMHWEKIKECKENDTRKNKIIKLLEDVKKEKRKYL